MPIFGYDVADYRDISPEYGSLEDFNRLVAEANNRNIRVVMDMVMNHTSDENTWFVQSRLSRTDPYRDWYVWRDGKDETATSPGEPPNNWGEYGHSSWVRDEKTRQYYYHHFSPHQPDLNWYNPAIEQGFKEITSYWQKLGVAGFRFDAIGTLFEDASFRDEPAALDVSGKPILDAEGLPVLQHLAYRLPRQPELPCCRPPAHPFHQHRPPNPRVQFHRLHASGIPQKTRLL
jgi:alpha-glucosidase